MFFFRRYPSRQVIEEKKALEQEKIKRGERIKDDNSKFNKEFQNKSKSKNKPNRLRNRKKKKKMAPISLISMEKEALDRKGVAPFLGIGEMSYFFHLFLFLFLKGGVSEKILMEMCYAISILLAY